MMSYLWILLLGSLLASSAKAQDDGAPAEEAATDSQTQSPKLDPTPEANGEPEADEERTPSAVEVTPSSIEPKPNNDPETEANATVSPSNDNEEPTIPVGDDAEVVTPADNNEEPTTPAGDDAEVVTPADNNEEPTTTEGDDAEEVTPVDDNEEPTTPASDDAYVVTPADDNDELVTPTDDDEEPKTSAGDDPEPGTPAGEDVEMSTAEADREVTATQVPVVFPENGNPEPEQTTATVEEEQFAADLTPVQEENGPDLNLSEIDEDNNEKEATDLAIEVKSPVNNQQPNTASPSDEEDNNDTNRDGGLEDVLSEHNPDAGKGRSFDRDAHVAGAIGDGNKPEPKASSVAGIVSAIGVAAVGAVAGYFTYQKKKLCFKNRQEADPEAARKADTAEAQSDPQVLSNLLKSA